MRDVQVELPGFKPRYVVVTDFFVPPAGLDSDLARQALTIAVRRAFPAAPEPVVVGDGGRRLQCGPEVPFLPPDDRSGIAPLR